MMQARRRSRTAGARCSPHLVLAVVALFLAGVGLGHAMLFFPNYTPVNFGTDGFQTSFVLGNLGGPVSFTITPSDSNWIQVEPNDGNFAGSGTKTIWVTLKDYRLGQHTPGTVSGSLTIHPNAGSDLTMLVSATYRPAPDPNAVDMLADLPPLPKPHYLSPFPTNEWLGNLDDTNDPMLIHFVRITHSVGVHAYWADWDPNVNFNVLTAATLCKRVNDCDPNFIDDPNLCDSNIPASISLYYEPYVSARWGWDSNYPDCRGHDDNEVNYDCNDPGQCSDPNCGDCQSCCETFAHYRQDFQRMATRLNQANQALGTNVEVTRILLDTEMWAINYPHWPDPNYSHDPNDPNVQAWNQAMVNAYNRFYYMCKEVFPDAKVGWYDRGDPTGYPSFNLEEEGDDYETELYNPLDWDDMQCPRFAAAHQLVHDDCDPNSGNCELVPWIVFSEGLVHPPKDSNAWVYVGDVVYDPNISWQMGSWLNRDPNCPLCDPSDPNMLADDVPAVLIYGDPLGAPDFFMQFRAYVKGACGIDPNDPNWP